MSPNLCQQARRQLFSAGTGHLATRSIFAELGPKAIVQVLQRDGSS